MQPTITSDVVVAYTQCPRKAYLLLFSTDKGVPHEYVQILEEKASTNRIAYLGQLKQEKKGVCAYDAENMARGRDVLIEVTLTIPGLVAYCDVLTPVQTGSPRSQPTYVPTMLVGTCTTTEEQKLALGVVGYILGQLQPPSPAVGILIGDGGQKHTVKLDMTSQKLRTVLRTLQQWLATPPAAPPPLILNKHCPYCPFRHLCREQAEHEDNLSLLDHMTPKVMQRYHKRGIFTVHQLSYLFKPRRRSKRSQKQPLRFNIEL
jgi:predicted RecB family nuclease